jgi:hypothetical protein
MSEQQSEDKDVSENEEVESTDAPAQPSRPVNPLSRPTDTIARPGFRNPANKRTKAQRKKRRKRK